MNARRGGSMRARWREASAPSRAARIAGGAASESYLVLLVGIATMLLLFGLGYLVTPDTWLALAAGRVVAHGGPPTTDTLTAWTVGRDWIDQQWLGQLMLFEIWRAGGLLLVGFVHVAVVIGAFVACIVGARRRGGSMRHVALVGLLAALPLGLVAGNIRAQTFALVCFVAVLWLTTSDSGAPSRRIFWCLPILVVWSNLHGSVIVGAGIVALGGLLHMGSALRRGRYGRPLLHGAAMIGLVALALFATPYGTSLLSYFSDTFGNPEIAKIAPEWMPVSLDPVHIPLFVLAGLTLVLLGSTRHRLSVLEQLLLVILLGGALIAERNMAWFALAALLLVPPLLSDRRGAGVPEPPPALLALVVMAVIACGVVAAAFQASRGMDRQVQSRFPSAAASVVAREARRYPSLKLFVHARYADWLLFRHPSLEGRVPFDIRFELLTPGELRRFRRFRDQIGDGWRRSMGDARLIVLDSSERPLDALPSTADVLSRERGARRLFSAHDVAVILRARRSR